MGRNAQGAGLGLSYLPTSHIVRAQGGGGHNVDWEQGGW